MFRNKKQMQLTLEEKTHTHTFAHTHGVYYNIFFLFSFFFIVRTYS